MTRAERAEMIAGNTTTFAARRSSRPKRRQLGADLRTLRRSLGVKRVHAAARLGIDIEQADSIEAGVCIFLDSYEYYREQLETLRDMRFESQP